MGQAVRIGHLSTFYHTSMLLMARGDADENLGREVTWRLFGTGPAIVDAFGRGELDLAYIGLPPAVIGIARGVDIVCIAGGHVEGTVLAGSADLRGFPETGTLGDVLAQLEGRRVGVPGRGSIHDVILSDALERAGLGGRVEVLHYAWADLIVEAVRKGEVGAACGTPALGVALRYYAGGRMLWPPHKLWPDNPSYGILARREFLGREPGTVRQFLLLHETASGELRERPRAAARDIANYVGFIGEDFVRETLGVSPRYCAQLSEGYVASTMAFVGAMRRLGYLEREPAREEIFDMSFIEKVHGSGDHYRESPGPKD